MRIVYLLFSFTVGGTEKLVSDICNEMSKRGNTVYLYIVNQYYDASMFDKLLHEVIVIKKDRALGSHKIFHVMKDLCEFCKKNKIDVIHCNAFNSPELAFLCKILLPKTKIVFTVHGIGQYETLSKPRVLYRNLVCDSLVAISESVKQDMIINGADARKIAVVYNAIDLSKYKRKSEYRLNKNHITIGNVARIDTAKKGQDVLVKALASLKDKYAITCKFAGEADESHQEDFNQLKELAQSVSSENLAFEFLGTIHDIPAFLEGIDIFVLPSRSEGFGISLIEAMQMKLPCIASNNNGPAEIIGDNQRGLLFENGNANQLAACIDRMIQDEALRNQYRFQAQKYVADNFDIRMMCDHLMNIYTLN